MAVAIISGVFAFLLAILSWLLTNGSRRGRLLSRIERQVAVLKDLPKDHPARAALDDALAYDANELYVMSLNQPGLRGPKVKRKRKRGPDLERERRLSPLEVIQGAAVIGAGAAAAASLVAAFESFRP